MSASTGHLFILGTTKDNHNKKPNIISEEGLSSDVTFHTLTTSKDQRLRPSEVGKTLD